MRITTLFILILNITFLKAQMDTTSYSVGLIIGQNLKSQGMTDLDLASFTNAVKDVLEGNEPIVSTQKANDEFRAYAERAQIKAHEATKIGGEQYLVENGKRAEVKTTASGLQYEVLTAQSTGASPTATSKVNVHYHGTLITGEVFDSSVDRGEPISFPLNGVIAGWTEGLQLMKVGEKYRFFIPQELAYGNRAAGSIAPYSTLIFDVELLGIE